MVLSSLCSSCLCGEQFGLEPAPDASRRNSERTRRSAVKFVTAMFGAVLFAGLAIADDVNWLPAQPIQTTRTVEGIVVVPVESPAWQGPKVEPAAKLGVLQQLPKPAPEGLPRPRELPELVKDVGPILPPPKPIEPVKPIAKLAPPPVAPVVATTTPKPVPAPAQPARTYRPQPWGPPPGPRSASNDANPIAWMVSPKR
jgi:hypothetical protein